MKKLVAVLLLLWMTIPSKAQNLDLYAKSVFKAQDGTELPYRVLLPAGYDKSRKYPLVLFLHGAGERGDDNEKQLVHGSKLFVTEENRKQYPAIVVFPQCPENGFWSSVQVDRMKKPAEFRFDYSQKETSSMTAVVELLGKLIKNEAVDGRRVYVTGLSMGGMGTFEMVYRHPEFFAAAMPICGGGDVVSYDKRVKKIPFWVFHGDADPVVNVKLSRDMVAKLREIRAKVKYSEYPGALHNSWDNAFAEKEFLSWMFRQRK